MKTYIDDLGMTIDTNECYFYAHCDSLDPRGNANLCADVKGFPLYESLNDAQIAVEAAVDSLIESGELDTVNLCGFCATVDLYRFTEEEEDGADLFFTEDGKKIYGIQDFESIKWLEFARGSFMRETYIYYAWANCDDYKQAQESAGKQAKETLKETVLGFWRYEYCGEHETYIKREDPFSWISQEVESFLEFADMLDDVEIEIGDRTTEGNEVIEDLFSCDQDLF